MVLFLLFLLGVAEAGYTRPGDPSWPNERAWAKFGESLSPNASLSGPIQPSTYGDECMNFGTDAYAISEGGDGMCMHTPACSHMFCMWGEDHDLPSYIVDARSEADISAALKFAARKNLPVSVKSTGHSYEGSSTANGALMIWMQHYPKKRNNPDRL